MHMIIHAIFYRIRIWNTPYRILNVHNNNKNKKYVIVQAVHFSLSLDELKEKFD